jgi:hypothetical protein
MSSSYPQERVKPRIHLTMRPAHTPLRRLARNAGTLSGTIIVSVQEIVFSALPRSAYGV